VTIPRGDAVALTRALVREDSRNPGISAGGPGEGAVARTLAAVLESWGATAEIREAAPGRPCVIARLGGGDGRSLMLNGHLDVVGIDGMRHEPFGAELSDGRIYGRGSADMKGGVAAMCAAAVRVMSDIEGEVVIAAVADEEDRSIGTRALIEWGMRTDAAIVTEPTRLAAAIAHRGFAWLEITVHGRAAHGSRYDIGIDAIRHAALLLAELDLWEEEQLSRRTHPLLGHASLHASHIEGGIGMSTYPDRCLVRVERRTVPGETLAMVERELADACARVRARRPAFRADVRVTFAQDPSDVSPEAPIVRSLLAALRAAGEPERVEGLSAWTDAAILNGAGVPAICFGPGDIALAHSPEEWVAVAEIQRCTDVLALLATSWCSRE
jgi:acetylornithine deacetylase